MIPRFLSLIGLMRRSEHEAKVRALESQLVLRENAFEAIESERDRLDDKFKKAVIDLAEQTEKATRLEATVNTADNQTIAALRSRDEWKETATTYAAEIASLRPDAEAMRAKRARDRDQKAARRKERVQP